MSTDRQLTLAERIAAKLADLSPTESRVASYVREHPEDVAFLSVTELARLLVTSDATVIRTAQSLGYAGFPEMRRELMDNLRTRVTPAVRFGRSLEELGDTPGAILHHLLETQIDLLDQARRSVDPDRFESALEILHDAQRILVFAVGPAAHLTQGFVVRLQRIGSDAAAIGATGAALADALLTMREGDAMVALAYEPASAEARITLAEAGRRGVPVVLLTDTLAGLFGDQVRVALTASRGTPGTFTTLTVTGVLLDALLLGLTARERARSLHALQDYNRLPARITGEEIEDSPGTV